VVFRGKAAMAPTLEEALRAAMGADDPPELPGFLR
jgi:hypothetical protein